jgi:DNA polymerase-3 subunit gamma/tau
MFLVSKQRGKSMPYLVSARKYRPQTFDGLIGQEHIANTLRNAIARKRVGHAYLFSGPRGIGKTSAARIFAKALNCEQGPTGNPCGICTFCREITEGRSLDLVEIDGASNRRIDEVRQLRENVRFVPSSARYKIYIIDEVHMLTTEAFNALLKTLEEPPEHVIFIFATTEVQKVPQTIRSRCQQFVFKRIPIPLIVQMLRRITGDLQVEAEERALFWIARSAAGSMRDAESILDQMISYAEGPIRPDDVFYVLGLPGYHVYHRFAGLIAGEDYLSCYRLLDELIKDGMEMGVLISGLLEYFRNLYVLSLDVHSSELIDLPKEDLEEMRKHLQFYGSSDIDSILTILSRVYLETRNSEYARELFEVALAKLVRFRDVVHPAELVQRLEALRGDLDSLKNPGNVNAGKQQASPAGAEAERENGRRGLEKPSNDQATSGSGTKDVEAIESRRNGSVSDLAESIIRHFSRTRRALAEFLKRAESYRLENNLLTISYDRKERLSFEHVHESSAKRYIEKEIRNFLQRDIRLNVVIDRAEDHPEEKQGLSEDVTKLMTIFKGEIVPND